MVGVRTKNTTRTPIPATAATATATPSPRVQNSPSTNGTTSDASSRSKVSVSRIPVCGTRSATSAPSAAIGSIAQRVAFMTSDDIAACSPPTRNTLRTSTVAVDNRIPLTVVRDAVTRPESTRIDSHCGVYWPSSTYRIGASVAPSPTIDTAASATNDNGTHSSRMPVAAEKQARCAARGDRAENTRCIRSIATRFPRPSATIVAQLIAAPCIGSVSCPKSVNPDPSGCENPAPNATHTSSDTIPTAMTANCTMPV